MSNMSNIKSFSELKSLIENYNSDNFSDLLLTISNIHRHDPKSFSDYNNYSFLLHHYLNISVNFTTTLIQTYNFNICHYEYLNKSSNIKLCHDHLISSFIYSYEILIKETFLEEFIILYKFLTTNKLFSIHTDYFVNYDTISCHHEFSLFYIIFQQITYDEKYKILFIFLLEEEPEFNFQNFIFINDSHDLLETAFFEQLNFHLRIKAEQFFDENFHGTLTFDQKIENSYTEILELLLVHNKFDVEKKLSLDILKECYSIYCYIE